MRFVQVRGDVEIAPGVVAFEAPGHYRRGTWLFESASEGSLATVIADVVPHPALLDQPEWVFAFDEDSVAECSDRALRWSRSSRRVDGLVVCGHYPGSGIGRLVTREGRVVWEPVP